MTTGFADEGGERTLGALCEAVPGLTALVGGGPAAGPETDAGESEETLDLPVDVVCDLLRNERRRATARRVAALAPGERLDLPDLARAVASEESGVAPEAVPTDHRRTVRIALYQVHLPKLADAGVVDYDERAGTVGRGPACEGLAGIVETVERAAGADGDAGRS